MIQYLKNTIQERIETWLINKFLDKTRASRATVTAVLWLASVDIIWVIKFILSRYGLRYLFKYILFLAML